MKTSIISNVLLFTITSFLVVSCGVSDNSEDIANAFEEKECNRIGGFWDGSKCEKLPALQILIDGEEKSELDFGAEIGVVSRPFEIVNKGEENLDWQIFYFVDWIKNITPLKDSLKAKRSQGVVVIIDRSKLESGNNETKIQVTSNDGNKELTVKTINAECKEYGYFYDYDRSKCVNPCKLKPCGSAICTSTGAKDGDYHCSCEDGMFWNGFGCEYEPNPYY